MAMIGVLVAAAVLRWAAWPAVMAFRYGLEIGKGRGARAEAARRGERLPPGEPESVGGGS